MARSNEPPREDRSRWTLKEHCDYANAQLELKDINVVRRRKGMGEVKWLVRDGRVVLAPKDNALRHDKPLTAREIANMPSWLRDIGMRVGFLEERDGKLVDSAT